MYRASDSHFAAGGLTVSIHGRRRYDSRPEADARDHSLIIHYRNAIIAAAPFNGYVFVLRRLNRSFKCKFSAADPYGRSGLV